MDLFGAIPVNTEYEFKREIVIIKSKVLICNVRSSKLSICYNASNGCLSICSKLEDHLNNVQKYI